MNTIDGEDINYGYSPILFPTNRVNILNFTSV
jgi:hypothetical protein